MADSLGVVDCNEKTVRGEISLCACSAERCVLYAVLCPRSRVGSRRSCVGGGKVLERVRCVLGVVKDIRCVLKMLEVVLYAFRCWRVCAVCALHAGG